MDLLTTIIPATFFVGLAALADSPKKATIYTLDGKKHSDFDPLPNADTFRKWAEQLRNSDEKAYTDVFRVMYNPLLLFALKFVKNRDEAKDILQDTFVKVWNIRSQIDPEKSLKALLYQMVRNNSLNHLKAKRGDELTDNIVRSLEDENPLPGEFTRSSDDLESRLSVWIEELPDRQQEAFELSRYDGLNHHEIADVMDCKPRTVNNHIVSALNTLRGKVDTYLKKRDRI